MGRFGRPPRGPRLGNSKIEKKKKRRSLAQKPAKHQRVLTASESRRQATEQREMQEHLGRRAMELFRNESAARGVHPDQDVDIATLPLDEAFENLWKNWTVALHDQYDEQVFGETDSVETYVRQMKDQLRPRYQARRDADWGATQSFADYFGEAGPDSPAVAEIYSADNTASDTMFFSDRFNHLCRLAIQMETGAPVLSEVPPENIQGHMRYLIGYHIDDPVVDLGPDFRHIVSINSGLLLPHENRTGDWHHTDMMKMTVEAANQELHASHIRDPRWNLAEMMRLFDNPGPLMEQSPTDITAQTNRLILLAYEVCKPGREIGISQVRDYINQQIEASQNRWSLNDLQTARSERGLRHYVAEFEQNPVHQDEVFYHNPETGEEIPYARWLEEKKV